jgi:hypothetical protein
MTGISDFSLCFFNVRARLSSLLKFIWPTYLSRGIHVGVHAPSVSHLLFADDDIVFTQAFEADASRLARILETYLQGSGQLVNRAKSVVFSAQIVVPR